MIGIKKTENKKKVTHLEPEARRNIGCCPAQTLAVTHNGVIGSIHETVSADVGCYTQQGIHARAHTSFYTQYGSAIEAKNIPAAITSPVKEKELVG